MDSRRFTVRIPYELWQRCLVHCARLMWNEVIAPVCRNRLKFLTSTYSGRSGDFEGLTEIEVIVPKVLEGGSALLCGHIRSQV
jgi:hypothetical protein